MRTGREYLRVSKDRSGRMRSHDEQHGDNDRAAAERGVRLGEPYREQRAVGASRYSRGTRDAFERLMSDLRAGRFGADELWLWESSRGSRKTGEWVQLADACEAAGVRIYVTTHQRLYDPANHRDRRTLLEDAVDAEYETAKTRERVNRGVRSRAVDGRPHGRHLYGYRREYDPITRAPSVLPDDAQAPIVREVFQRYTAGESFSAIARDLTARGVPTPRGANVWRPPTLLTMVRNEGYLGRRVSKAGHAPIDGAWPALVDEVTFRRARGRLDDRPYARADTEVRHLLSGIARCGVCGGKIGWHPHRRGDRNYPSYGCMDRFCVGRSARHLEAQVVEFVTTVFEGDPRVGAGDDPALAALEAEHAALVAKLEEWQEAGARPDGPSPAAVARVERELDPQIRVIEHRLRAARARVELPAGVTGANFRAAWPGLSLAQQRAVIAATVAVRVLPSAKGRRYDPDSVEITLRW